MALTAETVFTRDGVLEVLGHAVLSAQEFERQLGKCVATVFRQRERLDLEELLKIDHESKTNTLGRFVRELTDKERQLFEMARVIGNRLSRTEVDRNHLRKGGQLFQLNHHWMHFRSRLLNQAA